MLKRLLAFIRRKWPAIIAALLALAGTLRLVQGQKVKRLVKDASEAKSRAESLRLDAGVEAERQKARLKEQEARIREGEKNKERAAKLNERLAKLKKKHGLLLAVLGILLLALAAGPVKASDEAALPSDYAALARLYFQALDRIAELKADLEEAISIADEYKQLYEDERQLRVQAEAAVTEAESAVSRSLEREKQLQEVIAKQHETILQLASVKRSPLALTAGVSARVAVRPEGLALEPVVAVGVEYRP